MCKRASLHYGTGVGLWATCQDCASTKGVATLLRPVGQFTLYQSKYIRYIICKDMIWYHITSKGAGLSAPFVVQVLSTVQHRGRAPPCVLFLPFFSKVTSESTVEECEAKLGLQIYNLPTHVQEEI